MGVKCKKIKKRLRWFSFWKSEFVLNPLLAFRIERENIEDSREKSAYQVFTLLLFIHYMDGYFIMVRLIN